MAPDMPLAGVARIWLFLVHGEKRRFKGHTLFVDDMTDYVMPVLVGLYLVRNRSNGRHPIMASEMESLGILEVDFNQAIAIVGAIGSHWVHRMSEDSHEEEGVPSTGTRKELVG